MERKLDIVLGTFGDFSVRGWFFDKQDYSTIKDSSYESINIIADNAWSSSIYREIQWLRKYYPTCKITLTVSNFLDKESWKMN